MNRILLTLIIICLAALTLASFISCVEKSTVEPPVNIQADIAGRWDYSFFKGYEAVPDLEFYADNEGGFVDAITVNTANISGNNYLLLGFASLSGKYSSRIFIFAAKDPLSPQFISSIAPEKQGNRGLMVHSAAVSGNILYGGLFGDKGLWMADISDPAHPKDLGTTPLEMTNNLVVSGDYAYAVGQMYDGISISDISGTENPRQAARIDTVSRECRLAVNGGLLFAGIGRTLTVYDISNPSSPRQAGACELALSGNLSSVLPTHQPGEIHWGNWANILDLQVSGNYVYVAFGAGQLRVIDVSNPSVPKEISTVDLGGFAIALTLKDNLLYVTKSDKESQKLQMSIIDIAKPATPRLLDTVITESGFGFGGATFSYCFARPNVIGDYVYIAGTNYMDVIKVR
jgi:hypothetical protein